MENLDLETAQERIQTVLEAMTGGICTGWTAIFEVVLPDGQRELKVAVGEDVRTWTLKGWLMDTLDDLRVVT